MSYTAAIDELNAMVAELYTRPGHPRRKFSLGEIRILLAALGDPHLRFPSVLIAGTNGKGSTAASLASILTASGLRTGLYTSPHLARANERIRLDGAEIADDDFATLYFRVHDAAQRLVQSGELAQLPSFFEVLTAMAFLHFAQVGAEIAVVEVGMGGRLDATNILEPLLSVITDISLDHTEWLGSTIAAITGEKAGILRAGGTLITLPQHPEANQVLGEEATRLNVRGVSAAAYMPLDATLDGPYSIEVLGQVIEIDSPLTGAHQRRNLALAIAAAVELAGKPGFAVTPASIAAGVRQTSWPGRLERIRTDGQEWILDVAHNPAGAWALRAGLKNVFVEGKPRTLVFSCLRDKPLTEMAQILFMLFDQVIVAPMHTARATGLDDLLAAATATGTAAIGAESVAQALQLAQERAQGGVIVVSGSVYLVGEVRSILLAEREEQP
ncbi:MAG: bifunctional folylpolyglutamate synthase/dihydrofolate synthase [Terracidiphilus sp.]|nr:bifunctional folylpolyglutamate synthase/dihydrofolate synthase [Terracidiphilus sp.]MDR3775475.1 bifunctional folylpolyglutamate synthase/dihydrofolate synthase [Terracidiphilus sp.]